MGGREIGTRDRGPGQVPGKTPRREDEHGKSGLGKGAEWAEAAGQMDRSWYAIKFGGVCVNMRKTQKRNSRTYKNITKFT